MKNFVFTLLSFFTIQAYSQSDTIFYRSGEKVGAVVQEVNSEQIKYKKSNNLEGPTYFADVTELEKIKYKNGDEDVFKTSRTTAAVTSTGFLDDPYEGRASDDPNAKEYSTNDLQTESKMVYYGIDYTNVRMIGSAGFGNPQAIATSYFGQINQQIVRERSKFDFGKAFNKPEIEYDLEMLNFSNSTIDPYKHITNSTYSISESEIQNIVSQYNPMQQEGIGFVIVMETMNKMDNTGSFYFTFFDIKTKKVLLSERKFAFAQGFGFRNFWMSPIYEGLNQWNETHN